MKIDCREATRLTLLYQDQPLGLGQQVVLALHRLICAPCRAYRRQVETIRRLSQQLSGTPSPESNLDSGARERIRAKLRNSAR